AGILKGLEATTHWAALDTLAELGAKPTLKRVVEQGKIITAAGVSSGIDMGLVLAARIAGDEYAQTIQLGIEYDPQPPFRAASSGRPQSARTSASVVEPGTMRSASAGGSAPPTVRENSGSSRRRTCRRARKNALTSRESRMKPARLPRASSTSETRIGRHAIAPEK